MKNLMLFSATIGVCFCLVLEAKQSVQSKLPKDVQKIIERKGCCGHWSGEEPYDAERKNEIERALKECSCDKYEGDLESIHKKYKSEKDILKTIEDSSSDN